MACGKKRGKHREQRTDRSAGSGLDLPHAFHCLRTAELLRSSDPRLRETAGRSLERFLKSDNGSCQAVDMKGGLGYCASGTERHMLHGVHARCQEKAECIPSHGKIMPPTRDPLVKMPQKLGPSAQEPEFVVREIQLPNLKFTTAILCSHTKGFK